MQTVDGDLVVSATDLTRFLACRHLTRLDLEVARGERAAPAEADEALEVLFRRGLAHERAYLEVLRGRGLRVAEIPVEAYPPGPAGLRAAEADTVAAMAAGADAIHRAAFVDGVWRGRADLLIRRPERPGRWDWSYDVASTRLARRMTVPALLQAAVHADRLAVLQGVPPERLVIVTGDGAERAYRYDRCATYARGVRQELLGFVADTPPTRPEPVPHCSRCRWQAGCREQWETEDRLSLVAQLRPAHAHALQAVGVTTLSALASADPAALPPSIGPATARSLVGQAELQLRERGGAGPQHRLRPPEPARGLALLPEPSPGDVFFDIEGDPYAGDHGLEYLFGVLARGRYTGFWATGPDDERAAFEALVDHLVAAWAADPAMHVYHYASYELARLKALAGRYDTRVEEVDRLLRGQRLVDLYTVVKQGVQIGKGSYSLKKLEDHYWGHGREGAGVADALGSVAAFEGWLLAGSPPGDARLEDIRAYNEEDCRSTQALRDWLEGLRRDGGGDAVFARPRHGDGAPSPGVREQTRRSAQLRARLLDAGPDGPADAVRLLAALLDRHRREALPDWADHFRRAAMSREELIADPVAIGGLGEPQEVGRARRSVRWRLTFPPQETALAAGERGWVDPASGEGAGTVVEVRPAHGWLVVERAAGRPAPAASALAPPGPVDARVLADRLTALGEWVARHGIDSPLPAWRAGRDLLLRRPPGGAGAAEEPAGVERSAEPADVERSAAAGRAPLVRPGESAVDAVSRLLGVESGVRPGVLPVQGSPGTGTTQVAAEVVLRAIASGRRVGVSAFGHAAIGSLLRAVASGARRRGLPLRAVQRADAAQACADPDVARAASNDQVATALHAGQATLVAGTAWLFADPAVHGTLDLLVVDEAGQLSLADVLAMSGSARSLLLLGDPRQLTRPVRGSHPPGAGVSASEHLLQGWATVPADRGVLLDTTHRMHPQIADVVSDLSYDGRLRAAPGLERQAVRSAGPLHGSGPCWVPVPAGGSTAAVARLVGGLLADGCHTDATGVERSLEPGDVLVLAASNQQVKRLRRALTGVRGGDAVRVGTLEAMQREEAPVVIYELGGSGGDGRRGPGPALRRQRLTAALSRASALVAVVADPALLTAAAHDPDQLLRLDALCRYASIARQVRPGPS